MADGAAYQISIEASSIGVDSSAAQINQLATQLETAASKTTTFSAAMDRTRDLMAQAAAASTATAAAVASGQTKYNELEMAATKAVKAVEKATLSGKGNNMHVLLMEADAASQALATEAAALDALKAAASAAGSEEKKLAASMKALEKASAAAEKRSPFSGFLKGSKAVLGGPIFEKIDQLRGAFASGEGKAALAGVAVGALVTGIGFAAKAAQYLAQAFIAVGVAAVTGVIAMATFAIKSSEKAMKSLNATTKKAKQDFAKLFEGVGAEKFSDAVADVATMLDQSTSSGQALKELVSTILTPLFGQSASVGVAIKDLFKQAIILALQTATAFYLVKNALEGGKPLDPNVMLGLQIVAAAAVMTAIAVLAVVAVFAVFGAIALAVGASVAMLGVQIYNGVKAFMQLAGMASDAGSQIVNGLVAGITSGAGLVMQAMANLGGSAMSALKSALGIASPSKFAIQYMTNVTDTSADTLEKGTPGVQSAMESMVEPPDMPSAQSIKGGKQGETSNSKSMSISGNTFQFYGIKDAADAESKFSAMLTRLIEGDALQMGAEVPA